jgi:hypothetical protein
MMVQALGAGGSRAFTVNQLLNRGDGLAILLLQSAFGRGGTARMWQGAARFV